MKNRLTFTRKNAYNLKYTKSKLNSVYLEEHEKKAILSEMSHIQLDKKDI